MSSTPQLYSTPVFEIFRRGLQTPTIQRFRGLNAYSTLAQLGPEWAQDCLNVIVSGSGGLSKMRLPKILSAAVGGQAFGPASFWDFQQGNGTRQVIANFGNSLYFYTNDLANVQLIQTDPTLAGPWSMVSANNFLFGANGVTMKLWTGANLYSWGFAGPANAPGAPVVVGGALSPTVGYQYSYAWKNSVTSHVSNRTPVSPSTGAVANKAFQVTATAPPLDNTTPSGYLGGIDTIVWFRNLDGGGDQFHLAEVNLLTGAITTFQSNASVVIIGGSGNLGITDNSPDSALDTTLIGPLINNPPIVGKYLAVGQNRVFVFNIAGSPQDVIYSGYEQILLGRPEQSFPPYNRLRLSIGAETIAGGGVLQAGVVAFSQTGRMYMLRGQVEDITLAQPVNFSAYLEELPWTLGCASHFTIQATPYGLIWLAGDKTVQLFDGHSQPIDISAPVYPLLRRITPGTESQCISAYFNWLERDWYTLICGLDGALAPTHMIFFAANKQPDSEDLQSIEIFVSDLPSSLPGITWIGLLTNSKLQRMLCVAAAGRIQQLPVTSDTVGGLTLDKTINPATNGNLNAYWRSGYFGSDLPTRSKTFRWTRMISDVDPSAFKQTFRMVDDEQRTLLQPEIIGPTQLQSSRLGVNRKAKRMAVEINFPATDAPANVIELTAAYIGTADR